MYCSICRSDNAAGARFCANCRAPLVLRCANCHTELPTNSRFCLNCGQPVGAGAPKDETRLAKLAAAAPSPLVQKAQAADSIANERREVTILFADVVGSTALAEQMDLEPWTAIMNRAFDLFSSVIYRYEGTIARLLGDAVLAFFGAPVAHEDDPVRAVRAALDLVSVSQNYAREVDRRHGLEFAVRIGLNTGPVIVGPVGDDLRYDYTAMGGAVNLAARMQSAAQPMSVLISESTYRFVAPLFDCADLKWIKIKGKTKPVHVYEVRAPKPRPGRLRGLELVGLASPMVGRDAELATLTQLYDAVQAGRSGAALIIGEAGLGKTRLLAEWKASTPDQGNGSYATWAEGHCLSYDRGLAYHLLIDLIHSLIGVPAAADESQVRQALHTLTSELFPAHGEEAVHALDVYPYLAHLLTLELDKAALEQVRILDPEALQAQYVAALRKLLRASASRRPLVLVLEDIHWADPSSVEMLTKLIPLASTTPLLLCLVTRPQHDAPGWRLATAARQVLGEELIELTLKTLSESDSQRLVSNLLAADALPEEIRALISDKAEGNPLFVEEVIRMLLDQDAIVLEDGRWVAGEGAATLSVPDNLQGLFLARIDRLPRDARHTLRVASVIGRRFSIRLLAQVLGVRDDTTLHRQLSALESASLIRPVGSEPEPTHLFRHELLQDAVYASLLTSDRKQLHLAVGEALERAYPKRRRSREIAPRLAQHFAAAGDDQRALTYFASAGDVALASYANQEAESHYRAALGLAASKSEQANLSSGLGDALFRESRFEEAIEAWRQAIAHYQDLGESDGVARLYARSARAAWYGDEPKALKICHKGMEAVSDAPASPGLALLLHEAARAYFFNGLPEPVRPLCQRALEMAGHFDMVDVQADALATLGLLEDQPPEEALDLLTEAVELAEAAGLLYQATRAHTNLAHVLYNSMVDLQAARDHDRRAAELSRQRGSITSQLLGLGNVTHLSLLLGDFEEVEATLHKSRQLLTEIADPGTAAIHIRINEAMLLRCRGELTAAARLLRASQAEARQRGDLQDLFSANTDLADILLETCDPTTSEAEMAEAEVALLEAIETAERAGWSSVQPICQLSRVRTHQGQLKAAHRLLAQANEGSHSQPSAFDETHLMWAQMSLAAAERRWSEALAAMESAASFYARADMHWWRARALQESAELHASWDDPGQARDLERAVETLRQARAVFEAIGASGYVTFIEKRLSALQAG